MKKIEIDNIYYLRGEMARAEAELKKAIEAKGRKRSESGLKKANERIAELEAWIAEDKERFANYEAEIEEGKKLVASGEYEVVLARVPLGEDWRRDGEVERYLWNSVEEAEVFFNGYNKNEFRSWLEIRKVGEFKRIEELKAEMKRIEAELEELGGEF